MGVPSFDMTFSMTWSSRTDYDSKQRKLSRNVRPFDLRRLEQVGAKRQRRLPVSQPLGCYLEPAPDHPGIGPRTGHAAAPLRIIVLAAVHGLHQRQRMFQFVRKIHGEPFAEDLAQFERQTQRYIARLARARRMRPTQYLLDLRVVDRGD